MKCRLVEMPHGQRGHAPDSRYVDLYWTPVLGPTATLMWRRLVLEAPAGDLDVEMIGRELGVMESVALRTVVRLEQFRLVWRSEDELFVMSEVGNVRPRQMEKLTPRLRDMHLHVLRAAM